MLAGKRAKRVTYGSLRRKPWEPIRKPSSPRSGRKSVLAVFATLIHAVFSTKSGVGYSDADGSVARSAG